MRIENEAAYVLESRPYRETSLLLDVLTADYGRLALVARGARGDGRSPRQRRAALEPFQRLRIAFSGRGEVLSLGAVESLSMPLRPVAGALFAALYVNELVQRLVGRGDPVPRLFERYGQWLHDLAPCCSPPPQVAPVPPAAADIREVDRIPDFGASASSPEQVPAAEALAWSLRQFERDLLVELGYALALDHDSDSGADIDPDADYALDPEHGAFAWRSGLVWPRVRGNVLLAWAGSSRPEPETNRALKRLARAVIRHHLGGSELRAWRLAAAWQQP